MASIHELEVAYCVTSTRMSLVMALHEAASTEAEEVATIEKAG